MVHIGYFIDDICLPPADLTGTFHGISFYGFCMGGFKKDSTSGFLFSWLGH